MLTCAQALDNEIFMKEGWQANIGNVEILFREELVNVAVDMYTFGKRSFTAAEVEVELRGKAFCVFIADSDKLNGNVESYERMVRGIVLTSDTALAYYGNLDLIHKITFIQNRCDTAKALYLFYHIPQNFAIGLANLICNIVPKKWRKVRKICIFKSARFSLCDIQRIVTKNQHRDKPDADFFWCG